MFSVRIRTASHAQPVTTGHRNLENHTVITVFWRNCLGKWSHLPGKLCGAFHIWKEKPFLQHFYLGELWPLHEGFFYLRCILSVSLIHCIIHFFLTFLHLYILYSKENKKNFVKKDKYVDKNLPIITAIPYLRKFCFWK